MAAGQELAPGGCLISASDEYELIMQFDGNLVLYFKSQTDPLWDSNTSGNTGAYAIFQSDSNFVIYTASGSPIWNANTAGAPDAALVVQDDGNVVLYGTNPGGSAYAAWATNTDNLRGYQLLSGQTLNAGQYLESQNGAWTFSMTSPGYLVEASTVTTTTPYVCPIWSEPAIVNYNPLGGSTSAGQPANPPITTYGPQNLSFSYNVNLTPTSGQVAGAPGAEDPPAFTNGATSTSPTANAYLTMQTDGNLVLYGPGGSQVLWATGTNGNPGAVATLQTDGNFVVSSASGQVLWSSGTNAFRGSALCTDRRLNQGQYLGFSSTPNGAYLPPGATLVMQNDCNLVLYVRGSGILTSIWQSGTDMADADGTLSSLYQGCYLVMQNDDNLVIYAPNDANAPLWQSNTDAGSQAPPTGNPFVGPYWLSVYNPYLILQRWGAPPAWKADPLGLLSNLNTVATLSSGTAGSYVASGVYETLTNDQYDLQDALETLGWL